MGGKLYVGVSGTATKVKKLYVGVNGIARKVKKLYVGVNGIARKVFSSGISYYGTATSLSSSRPYATGATIGNYAVIAGGGAVGSTVVDSYSASLVRTSTTSLAEARYKIPSGTHGSYAAFVGGSKGACTNVIDAYDSALTHTTPNTMSAKRTGVGGTSSGTYFLVGGGNNTSGTSQSTVYGFDTSFSRVSVSSLSYTGGYCAGVLEGNIVFIGGNSTTASARIQKYNSSLTLQNINIGYNIDANANYTAAANAGNYLLFAGGARTSQHCVAINTSFSTVAVTDLTNPKRRLGGGTLANCAIFAGGDNQGDQTTVYADAEMYDASLTKSNLDSLSVARYGVCGVSVGNYLLFAGGYKYDTSATVSGVVDVYEGP